MEGPTSGAGAERPKVHTRLCPRQASTTTAIESLVVEPRSESPGRRAKITSCDRRWSRGPRSHLRKGHYCSGLDTGTCSTGPSRARTQREQTILFGNQRAPPIGRKAVKLKKTHSWGQVHLAAMHAEAVVEPELITAGKIVVVDREK